MRPLNSLKRKWALMENWDLIYFSQIDRFCLKYQNLESVLYLLERLVGLNQYSVQWPRHCIGRARSGQNLIVETPKTRKLKADLQVFSQADCWPNAIFCLAAPERNWLWQNHFHSPKSISSTLSMTRARYTAPQNLLKKELRKKCPIKYSVCLWREIRCDKTTCLSLSPQLF